MFGLASRVRAQQEDNPQGPSQGLGINKQKTSIIINFNLSNIKILYIIILSSDFLNTNFYYHMVQRYKQSLSIIKSLNGWFHPCFKIINLENV